MVKSICVLAGQSECSRAVVKYAKKLLKNFLDSMSIFNNNCFVINIKVQLSN